ncbi:hypothetical protein FB45DRAFT_898148 [Roridomyces roridus]|uniref:Uncharacterized protein n=1 Tax=Roridomyces roridus TaxID=1738132 RepID=A0AAD7CCC9_9AGAR|nr:hypothetical protein FB45DRAFT_898148 [Roridomyces roridus]
MDVDMLECRIQPVDSNKIFSYALRSVKEQLENEELRRSQDLTTLLKSAEKRAETFRALYEQERERCKVLLVAALEDDSNGSVVIQSNFDAEDALSALLDTNRNLEEALRNSQENNWVRAEEMARALEAPEARTLGLTQEIGLKDVELESLRSALDSSRSETCAKDKALSELAIVNRDLEQALAAGLANVVLAGDMTIRTLRVKLDDAEARIAVAASHANEIQLKRELELMTIAQRYGDETTRLRDDQRRAVEALKREEEQNDVLRAEVLRLQEDLLAAHVAHSEAVLRNAEIEAKLLDRHRKMESEAFRVPATNPVQVPLLAPLPSPFTTGQTPPNWSSPQGPPGVPLFVWPATTVGAAAASRVAGSRKAAKGPSSSTGVIPISAKSKRGPRCCSICVKLGKKEEGFSCGGRGGRIYCRYFGTDGTVGF